MADKYDLAVIGGGPGGYVAAIRAAQLGMKTVLIEREHLGGICLNWGCIPTKALLRSAEIYDYLGHAESFGLKASGIGFDLPAIVERSRKTAKQLNQGVAHLLKKNSVDVVMATARLEAGAIRANAQTIQASHTILATGARARTLPGMEPDGDRIWSYKEAMVPKFLPKRLLVVGSGAIGIEFASFYQTLGCEVTVIEMADRILPVEDTEISALAAKQFTKRGLRLKTSTTLDRIERKSDHLTAHMESGSLDADAVIMAIGITGNIENLGLKAAGIKTDRGHVVTDAYCRTSAKSIYAIGDLTGPPWLAHKASHEGVLCVEAIAGMDNVHPIDVTKIPGCTYCQPQIASLGLTEEAAKKLGKPLKIGRFPYLGNGKAIALGEPEGLIKTIFDEATGELLGAHMIGAEVTELIQGYAIARQLEATELDLMHTIFPHPTLSEMMHESVLDAWGRAIHF